MVSVPVFVHLSVPVYIYVHMCVRARVRMYVQMGKCIHNFVKFRNKK